MEKRRFNTVEGNIDLYIFLTILAGLFHIYIEELAGEPYFFSTTALSYLLLIYIGYKFGRNWGALAGLLSSGYWFLLLLMHGNFSVAALLSEGRFEGMVFGDESFLAQTFIFYASLQYVLIFTAIGYVAGWVMDVIEETLRAHHLALIDLLPRYNDIYLQHIGVWLERVIRAVFLLQLESVERKALLLSRLRKLFVLIVILPLLYYFNLLSFWLRWDITAVFSLYLPPLAPVIILWIAYAFGPRQGVLAALALLLSPIVFFPTEGFVKDIGLHVGIGISSPASVIALAAAAWVLGSLGRALKNEIIRERLNGLFVPDKSASVLPIKMWHVLLLVVSMFSISYRTETFIVYWDNYGPMILLAAISGLLFDVRQASNAILLVVGLGVLLYLPIWLDDYNLAFKYGRVQFHELVFLALIPLLVSLTSVKSLKDARILMALLIGLAWLAEMLTSSSLSAVYPAYLLSLNFAGNPIPLFAIAMTMVLIELGARILCWVASQHQAADNVNAITK